MVGVVVDTADQQEILESTADATSNGGYGIIEATNAYA